MKINLLWIIIITYWNFWREITWRHLLWFSMPSIFFSLLCDSNHHISPKLKLRLCNHLKTTVETAENGENENAAPSEGENEDDAWRERRLSEFNDADASSDDERFEHMKQLEIERRQRMNEVKNLRCKLQNMTCSRVRGTNTKAKRVENDETVAQSEPRRRESVSPAVCRMTYVYVVRGTNGEVAATTIKRRVTKRERHWMNAVFSFGDIGDAFNTFNGDYEYAVKATMSSCWCMHDDWWKVPQNNLVDQ